MYFTSDCRLPQHEKVLQWVGCPPQAADLLSSVGCPKDKAETSLGVLFTEVKCLASPYKNAALTQRLKHKYTSILFKRTGKRLKYLLGRSSLSDVLYVYTCLALNKSWAFHHSKTKTSRTLTKERKRLIGASEKYILPGVPL